MENTRLNVPADFAPILSAMLCDTFQTRIKYTLSYSVQLNTQDDLVFFAREIRTGLLYRLWETKPFFQHDLTKQVLTVLINSIEKVVMGAWHVPHCLFPYYATNLNAWFELPHTSAKDNTKIATFKTVDAVFRDIQTVQKPAKWFKEFAKGSDVMASEFNNTFLNSIVKPPVFWSLRELNRHDQDAWIWVYQNTQGTGSCMSNGGRSECVKVYAHPDNDLDLVFTTKGDRVPFEPGTIVNSRSIFDARDNQFVRIYSDTHLAHHAFLAHVESRGSKETRELNEGHKLLKIEHYHGDNRYFMPYLDGVGAVTDEGDHFTTGGDIDASNTSGWCELRGCCPCCGGSMEYTVWIDSEGQDVCEDCASSDYFYCQLTNEYYNNRTYDEVTILDRWGNRESAEEMVAQNSGYLRCEVGQFEDIYLHPSQAIEDYAGSIIHIDEAHYCELDESYYHESDLDMMPTPDSDEDEDDTPEAEPEV